MEDEKPKVFTLQQANRSLSQIQTLLTNLRKVRGEILQLEQDVEILDIVCNRRVAEGNPDLVEYLTKRQGYHTAIGAFDATVRALNQLGCLVHDLDVGVVHFVGHRQSQEVLLCWKEGDEKVGHWHTVDRKGHYDEDQRFPIGDAWRDFS